MKIMLFLKYSTELTTNYLAATLNFTVKKSSIILSPKPSKKLS